MTEKAEFDAGVAKRVREVRLCLGYKTAASFARAIGYTSGAICRYERVGMNTAGTIIVFVKAVEDAGFGKLSIGWLLNSQRMWLGPPTKPAVRTEGNVVHGAFGR